ncbi:MAG TPA: urease accessory protein UreE [Gammaproteobacteria bacterium]|nr:urease accessory protein UreE [Gammaproteobacteria bacterium]OUU55986.1 MAG: urease accessory protein UreE [Proteobacteria bacterium TMED61]RZO21364.1 MAG: urease accessory protein UreE [Candidatus Thioglobus sp.]HAK51950.1 urease accessory protein UreE [Gammaproteobacteria bacterium]
MIKITKRVSQGKPTATLELPFEIRVRARFKSRLKDGREIGVFLDRGPIIRGGDLLQSEDGILVQVQASLEKVSTVRLEDSHLLSKAAYHLGNRHVPLQVLPGELRYQHDHVLDLMMASLGIKTVCEQLPFEPEPGAYGEHGVAHGHSHSH